MYKCLSLETGEPILSLASQWRKNLKKLRTLADSDNLVCQGCKQPVRLKAGKTRRWHFAHKHLENCPFVTSSPTLIYARSVIYDWLVERYGEKCVDVEIYLPKLNFPRPVDLSLQTDQSNCLIWIIETRMKPSVRESLHESFASLGNPSFYIFLDEMHHPVPDQPGKIYLTTTERECAQTSDYDYLGHPIDLPIGQSLHYLDPTSRILKSYRDLLCVHKPQVFSGRMHVERLDNIYLDLLRGTPVFPGEGEKLKKLTLRREHRKEKVEGARKVLGEFMNRMLPDKDADRGYDEKRQTPNHHNLKSKLSSASAHSQSILVEAAICMLCGQTTNDWWYLDRATGLCKCRTCLKNGVDSVK